MTRFDPVHVSHSVAVVFARDNYYFKQSKG